MKLGIILTLPVFLVLSSCGRNAASPPQIPEEKFINFYADLMTLENQPAGPKPDTLAFRKSLDSLYRVYSLDSTSVRQNITYYNRDLDHWRDFYVKVIARLEKMSFADTTQHKM